MECALCAREIEEICSHCLRAQNTCIFCYQSFDINDKVIRCKECNYLGHHGNFLQWLQTQASCPVCRVSHNDEVFEEIVLANGTIQDLFLRKYQSYLRRQEAFADFQFQFPYYQFQEEIIQDIIYHLENDDSHLFISPPGSGKTIIGLAIATYFSSNTLVLTPNLAVLGSWINRLSMFFDETKSNIKLQDVYTRSTGSLNPITITTYQQLNASMRSFSTKSKNDQLRTDYENYIQRLLNHNIGLVILDEAHRLTGK